jgi:hypothetical protein
MSESGTIRLTELDIAQIIEKQDESLRAEFKPLVPRLGSMIENKHIRPEALVLGLIIAMNDFAESSGMNTKSLQDYYQGIPLLINLLAVDDDFEQQAHEFFHQCQAGLDGLGKITKRDF